MSGGREPDTEFSRIALLFWQMLLVRNVFLLLLNMIPVPPLDGFHVLEGFFDLGALGDAVKRLGVLAFIVVIVVINMPWFWDLASAIVHLVSPDTAWIEARR